MDKYIDFKKIPECKKRVKIDIGLSYNAPFTQIWFENDNKNNDLYVFGFEPNPENYNSILNKNIVRKEGHGKPLINEYINDDYMQLIPVALSDKNGEMDFYCMKKDSGTSSLYRPVDNGYLGDIKEVVKVPVFTLKDFFDIFDWNKFPIIEYIKIDAQGSDFDILKGAGDYLKERVVYITAEAEEFQYHDCKHNNLNNMKDYLEKQNFIFINKHPNTSDPTFINKKFIDLFDKIFIYQEG